MEKIFKAKMNIQLICAIIVFFSTGFREIRANRMVDTEPHNVTTVEGTSANFLCRFGEPISYCRFEVPGRGVLNLSPNWPSRTPGYEYFGGGLEQGQCGLSIKTIRSENNGDVKCFVGAPGEEVGGVIPLTVAIAASQTQIDLHGQNDGQFQINQVMHVTCIARDARPPADIYWYLDDQQITNGLSNIDLMELANQTGAPTTLFTTSQTLQRPIQASDDRKTLKCVTSNAANLDQPQIKTLQLTVRFAPQPLPEIRVYGVILSSTALINVTLRSNPRPRIEWNVDGNAIQQGTRTGRYEAYEPIDLGNGVFNVTLSIAGLTLEDTSKIYRLRASNEFGSQDYTVRISSSEAAISDGLGVGSIIGIVVGIIILLTIVLLIVVARIKGKWCFADSGSTTKPPHPSETSDTESGADVKQTKNDQKFRINFGGLFKKKSSDPAASDATSKRKNNNANIPDNNPDAERINNEEDDDDENAAPSEATVIIEDDPPQKGGNLVYAELMLKPSEDGRNPNKNSTEYAEILCVQPPPLNAKEQQKKTDKK